MITKLKQGGKYIEDKDGVYTEFVCATISDIAKLPTGKNSDAVDRPRPGSTALVTAAAMVYVLSNEREWVVLIEG